MPKYVFKCSNCNNSIKKIVNISCKTIQCNLCESDMGRQMPNLRGMKATETVDKFSNKKHVIDQKDILKERSADYYWSTEVPKMVNSGTYSIETMLEQGWVYYNEKDQLTTRTKPPQKS